MDDISATPQSAAVPGAPQEPPRRPSVIRREDYRPPEWLVPEIALAFDLGLAETSVTANLKVERNPAAEASSTLRLNGDGLYRALDQGRRAHGQRLADGRRRSADRPPGQRAPRRDREPSPSRRQQPAHGALRLERHALHPVRGRGLSPDHLLPRPARRAFGLPRADDGPRTRSRCCSRTATASPRARRRTARIGPNGTIPGPSRATCSRWSRAIWSPTMRQFTTDERPRGRSRHLGARRRRAAHPACDAIR